jgi:hypothetical protein
MTLTRASLLPALLSAIVLFTSGCEQCEDGDCDETPAPLEEGTWKLRFPSAPTMSAGCERLGMEVEALDPIYVQIATPSDWTFVMDLESILIRGERYGDSLVGEGDIDAMGTTPDHPEEVPDRDTDDVDSDCGTDDETGDVDDKCETEPAPDDRSPNTIALDATVQSPTDIVGELIVHLEAEGTICEASFGFKGSFTGEERPDEPVVHSEVEEERPPVESGGGETGSSES